jgi:hypothetical protein
MRLKMLAALMTAASVVGMLLPADPAAAAPKKKQAVTRGSGTVVAMPDANGRTRPRIIIQRRSFLDGGTEVLPGERKFTDYAFPPNYSVTGVFDNTAGIHRSPLPGPWDIPGRDNPGQRW